jgi:hypothetical protein
MAKRAAIVPQWARTLDGLIAGGHPVRVWCDRCGVWREIDLIALRDRVGGDYSLINRRTRCRLTEGCAGWNRFTYQHGVFRPLRE